ncbi:uncharacterized protein LOC124460002 [Drosophila willistoni]|uniref:uncharacterized protein LOC124460002 n=1 Tax=Drosophila willistoni TaxID=7260 RepID=UPI001F07F1FA|nr:uncharacterized protein LOC124460002 [Drosophila willistoni]
MRKFSRRVRQRYRSQVAQENDTTFSSKDNLITLIRFYAGHECLWNELNPDYYDSNKRNHLWSWIARQFGPKTYKSDVEFEIQVLQKRALQEFERIEHFQGMGMKCKPTFELINEFQFLLDDGEEVNKQVSVEVEEDSALQSNQVYPESAETKSIQDVNVFCCDLKEELSRFPPKIRLKTQQKILFIMNNARNQVDKKSKKNVHWNI